MSALVEEARLVNNSVDNLTVDTVKCIRRWASGWEAASTFSSRVHSAQL